MDDKATPEKGAVLDLGGGFVADFSDFFAQEGAPVVADEPPEDGTADNAAIEGEQVVPEPEAAAEPEKKAEPEKPPEPESAAAPEEPKTYEFKIKYRGEEMTEKLTTEQIVARLQMSKDYTVKTEELAEKRRKVEAVERVTDTPWFKETYEEAIRTGAIEAQPAVASPAVDPLDKYEFEKRKSDPDFEDVRGRMREYALTLPAEAQEILSNNHKVFNQEYDRIAEGVRKKKESPPPAPSKIAPEVAKKILQAKEVVKSNAVVERAGVGSPDADPSIQARKQLSALRRQAKEGDRNALEALTFHAMFGELPT